MRATVVFAIVLLAALTTPSSAQESRRYIDSSSVADSAALPFSGAVLVGNTLYLSGAIGLDQNQQVPATAEEEARNVMDRIKERVEAAGLSMDDLVSVQVFCSDVTHYDAFNGVYRTYFTGEFPARAFLGAGTLLFGARFEVQGIAVRR